MGDQATRAAPFALGPQQSGRALALSPEGERLAQLAQSNNAVVADSMTGFMLSTLRVDGLISSLDFSPCGTKIAATSDNLRNRKYQEHIFNLNSQSRDWVIQSESTLRGGIVSSVSFSAYGSRIAAP